MNYPNLKELGIIAHERPPEAGPDITGWAGASQRSARCDMQDGTGEFAVPKLLLQLAELGAERLARRFTAPTRESDHP